MKIKTYKKKNPTMTAKVKQTFTANLEGFQICLIPLILTKKEVNSTIVSLPSYFIFVFVLVFFIYSYSPSSGCQTQGDVQRQPGQTRLQSHHASSPANNLITYSADDNNSFEKGLVNIQVSMLKKFFLLLRTNKIERFRCLTLSA